MAKVKSRSPTRRARKTIKFVPTIDVTKLRGFRDRITVSLGAKIQIVKYEFDASPFYSYSTDVGMYNKDETLEEAKERASNFVNDSLGEVLGELEKEKKNRKK